MLRTSVKNKSYLFIIQKMRKEAIANDRLLPSSWTDFLLILDKHAKNHVYFCFLMKYDSISIFHLKSKSFLLNIAMRTTDISEIKVTSL